MRFAAIILVAVSLAAAGCSIIMPADREMLHGHHLNAQAFNAKTQSGEASPEAMRAWIAAEARTWAALDAWSKGEKPAAAAAPAPSAADHANAVLPKEGSK